MTRKRVIRLLMATGASRNTVREFADAVVSLKEEEDRLAARAKRLGVKKLLVVHGDYVGLMGSYQAAYDHRMRRAAAEQEA